MGMLQSFSKLIPLLHISIVATRLNAGRLGVSSWSPEGYWGRQLLSAFCCWAGSVEANIGLDLCLGEVAPDICFVLGEAGAAGLLLGSCRSLCLVLNALGCCPTGGGMGGRTKSSLICDLASRSRGAVVRAALLGARGGQAPLSEG
ncbi:hypothetical protein CRG98_020228 [Punica granatum]|uniref:Uncharacterized protein n=1 Tax=Punica granatum TaxID=22663 RepID=A0A2I0JSV2_PUNGR|nr:hypothetical protein CRG98_020228 [Punica granatum]